MTIDSVRKKYNMNIDNVLNVRAMYDVTVTVAADAHLDEL